jgi:DNA-directed RNA polymerase subunit RPC12/RpoP
LIRLSASKKSACPIVGNRLKGKGRFGVLYPFLFGRFRTVFIPWGGEGGSAVDMLNLDNAVVMYEGQQYSAKDLMLKLQEQIRDAATRLNSIAFLLDELYKAMENTKTVEVKLSLSKEEYERFKTIGGENDRERILQAIRSAIEQHPAQQSTGIAASIEPMMASLGVPKKPQSQPAPKANPRQALVEDLSVSVSPLDEPPATVPEPVRRKPAPKCPRCSQPLNIPDVPASSLPIEVKCDNCGAKCLIKSKTNAAKSEKAGFESFDDPSFGNIFDMLST